MRYRMKSHIRISFFLIAFLAAMWMGASSGRAQEEGEPAAESQPDLQAPKAESQPKDYSPYPHPDAGYVTDLAHLLTPDQEERIERWLWQTESRTGVEIIVVTIYSVRDYVGPTSISDAFTKQLNEKYGAFYPESPASVSIETFARGLFDKYGIGNMPQNNGVLLLVAVKDRKARIELGAGYAHARDADADRIMQQEILPYFRKDDYAGGITSGVKAIMLTFANVRVGYNWPLIIGITAIPVVGLIAYSLFRSGKRGWGWICVGLLIVLILFVLWVLLQTLRHMPRGRSGGWSPGGAGGFGGGFSGGGGATGSW